MNYQGNNVAAVVARETTEYNESAMTYSDMYGVTEERARELGDIIAKHWSDSERDGFTDAPFFLSHLPIEAATPGEVMLTGIFVGQLMARMEDECDNPVRALVRGLARHFAQ